MKRNNFVLYIRLSYLIITLLATGLAIYCWTWCPLIMVGFTCGKWSEWEWNRKIAKKLKGGTNEREINKRDTRSC